MRGGRMRRARNRAGGTEFLGEELKGLELDDGRVRRRERGYRGGDWYGRTAAVTAATWAWLGRNEHGI